MDGLIECLKDSNERLAALTTKDESYVAWITYSVENMCFIAGVDMALRKSDELPVVIHKESDASPIGAMNAVRKKIMYWQNEGQVTF